MSPATCDYDLTSKKLAKQAGLGWHSARGGRQRIGEFGNRLIAIIGVSRHGLVQRLFYRFRDVEFRTHASDRDGIAPETSDHHFLLSAALERKLSRQHLICHE